MSRRGGFACLIYAPAPERAGLVTGDGTSSGARILSAPGSSPQGEMSLWSLY